MYLAPLNTLFSSHRGMNLTGFMPSPAFRMPSAFINPVKFSLFPRSQVLKKVGHGKLKSSLIFQSHHYKIVAGRKYWSPENKSKSKKTGTLCGSV